MSDVIPTQRVRVVADAVVSAYLNEIAAPARPRPVAAPAPPRAVARRRPLTRRARGHAPALRRPVPVAAALR